MHRLLCSAGGLASSAKPNWTAQRLALRRGEGVSRFLWRALSTHVAGPRSPQAYSRGAGAAWTKQPQAKAAQPWGDRQNRDFQQDEPIGDTCKVTSGKHSGKSFAEVLRVEPGYCKWLVDTSSQSPTKMKNFLPLVVYVQRHWLQQLELQLQEMPQRQRPQASPSLPAEEMPQRQRPQASPSLTAEEMPQRERPQASPSMPAEVQEMPQRQRPQASPSLPAEEMPQRQRPQASPSLPAEVWGREGCLESKAFVLTGNTPQSLPRAQVEEMIRHFGGVIRSGVSGKTDFLLVLGEELDDWKTGKVKGKVETSMKFQKAQALNVHILRGIHELVSLMRSFSEEQQGGAPSEESDRLVRFALGAAPPA